VRFIDQHFFLHVFWQHVKSRAIIDEHLSYEANFAPNSNVQGFVMSGSFSIKLICCEVQIIGGVCPSHQMLHGFLLNVLRYISLIQYLLQGVSMRLRAEYQGYKGDPGWSLF
jgi:hypothetical protein